MEKKLYDCGMIGLGTMGRNLLYNICDHGYTVAGYDKDLLLQAQRDYFGAHTYERTDRKGTFHNDWNQKHH